MINVRGRHEMVETVVETIYKDTKHMDEFSK